MKPLFKVTISPFVVSVRLRGPADAAASMVSTAVAAVGELIVSVAIAIPAPNDAVVVP